jgi:hypothetical protein
MAPIQCGSRPKLVRGNELNLATLHPNATGRSSKYSYCDFSAKDVRSNIMNDRLLRRAFENRAMGQKQGKFKAYSFVVAHEFRMFLTVSGR